jgi:hypothetical protein
VRIRSLVPLALSLVAAPLVAQNSPAMSPAAAIPEWRSFFGANPLGIPFDIVSVELETTIAPAATLGFVGSYNDIDNRLFTTFDGRFKYYPGEIAMRGFSVGVSGGYTKFRGNEGYDCLSTPPYTCSSTGFQTLNAGTLGVLVDYNWTQGPSQRFVIGTGVGAKRILASVDERNRVGLDRAYVTGRFVIGLLF